MERLTTHVLLLTICWVHHYYTCTRTSKSLVARRVLSRLTMCIIWLPSTSNEAVIYWFGLEVAISGWYHTFEQQPGRRNYAQGSLRCKGNRRWLVAWVVMRSPPHTEHLHMDCYHYAGVVVLCFAVLGFRAASTGKPTLTKFCMTVYLKMLFSSVMLELMPYRSGTPPSATHTLLTEGLIQGLNMFFLLYYLKVGL